MRIADLRLPIADCRLRTANAKRTGWQHRSASKPTYWLLLSLLVISCLAVHGLSAEPAPASATLLNGTSAVQAVDAVGMTVADMDRSIEFFSNVLTFEKVSDVEATGSDYERLQGLFGVRMRVVRMKLGNESIELTEYLAPRGRPFPSDTRSNDHWFQHIAIIVSDMDAAYRILRQHKVQHASSGPQRLPDWNKNAGGIQAFYFRDPDGHFLEILQFPEGKGDPKWQRKDQLFLGIDHTAIVVKDTEESLKFYRDTLGFKVVGVSENYDTEQEHLNNVFGARLRITALRTSSGPGIEFLEYLAPRDGRPMPVGAKANDIAHWQTRVLTQDVSAAAQATRNGEFALVSPGVISLPSKDLGISKGILVRDPDGHVIELAER
jgi:catechol 2,3-dioxygenase-like lactoylglutathione lyase family enzyme